MWNSILKKDKEVCGHYEAIHALSRIKTVASCNTLTNIVRDPSFFYRLRTEAAEALVNFDTPECENLGLANLVKLTRDMCCMPTREEMKYIPKRNNFESLQEYYIRKSCLLALSRYRDAEGNLPSMVRNIICDLLRYNDNTQNPVNFAHFSMKTITMFRC
jgi:transcription initiation factor TFIID subunit 2